MNIDRRVFMGFAAGSLLPAKAAKLKTVGAQLYTLRSVLPKKPLETLQALQGLGYQEIEAVGMGLDQIWGAIQQTKLKPISVHLDTGLFLDKTDGLPSAIDAMKAKGFRYVVCPYVPPPARSPETMQKLAQNLNKAGELAKKAGMELCYHNHAFEFEPTDGTTILDQLLSRTDAKLVKLELDIMWSQVAGVSPVDVLKKYPGRVPLIHLKNVAPGIARQYNERVPREAFKEVGSGSIDIAAVLKAAGPAGVKHFFVEQDQTPGEPLESLKASIEYLKGLNY